MNAIGKRGQPGRRAAAALVVLAAGLVGAQPAERPPAEPAAGERIFIMADSMGELVFFGLKRQLASRDGVTVDGFISLGSGLARPDLFDWPAKLRSVMEAFHPTRVVIFIGTTDVQQMKSEDGILAFGAEAWKREYARRVETILQICGEGRVRSGLWIGLPDVRDPQMNRDLKIINGLFQEAVAGRRDFSFLDTAGLFSPSPGTYSAYVVQDNGMPLHVRSADGKHFNTAGAEKLAREILDRLAPGSPPRAGP